MNDEEATPRHTAEQLVDAIRAYLESINLPDVEMTVEEDDDRIHIAGKGWDVYLAKTHFLHIRLPDRETHE